MSSTTETENQKRYKVLIVDDVPENIQILANILSKRRVDVAFAVSGKQAIQTLAVKPFDLILLDVMMPEMNGFEVCEILKKDPALSKIPVIFLTARIQPEDIIKGFSIGAVDYVTKPFNSVELVSRVFTHLELKKARDTIEKQNKKLKRQNTLLDSQNKRLSELNATKDKFFSIVAHDLMGPFNTLIGFSEYLISEFDNLNLDKIKEFHQHIRSSAKHGHTLLENLLEWARSQTGTIRWEPQNTPVAFVIRETVNLLKVMAEKKEQQIVCSVKEDLAAYFDQKMILTVLRNLISNAIKFTPCKGVINIIAYKKDEQFVEINVTDTGIGIDPEDIEKLFRIDISHSTPGTNNETGTGLGLILCKEFVEKNGGTIYAESEQNKGSRFAFTLPVRSDTAGYKHATPIGVGEV